MNSKVHSMDLAPEAIAAGRILRVHKPAAPVAHGGLLLLNDAARSREPVLWLGMPSADAHALEFWETLSYAVIWLCAWIGIALSLLAI